ncbi:MAG: hypothetical protein IKD18_03190 [Clostridia bacterium]|nr:hypothetical protein [Clostridia bacterium]
MRKIEFDLTENESMPRYRFAGFEGEHNATLLTVLLPERMRKGNEAEYRFLFETASGEAVFSAALPLSEEGALSVLLTRSLMVAPELKAYVGCYVLEEGEPVLVAKSGEMVLGVQRSLTNESGEMDRSGGEVPGLVIDTALSAQSRNPVENRAVYAALEEKAEKTEFNRFVPRVNEALKNAEEASTYANQTAYRAQIAAQDAIQATANASQAATNAENSMLMDAYIDEDGVLFLKQKGKGDIYVGKVKGDKGDPGIADNSLSANAIKGKKSGEIVVLTDVSPLEHEMAVKVSQGGVKVQRFGKNLVDVNAWVKQNLATFEEDGSFIINNASTMNDIYGLGSVNGVYKPINGNLPIVISGTVKSQNGGYTNCFVLDIVYSDGTTTRANWIGVESESNPIPTWQTHSVKSISGKTIDKVVYQYTAARGYVKDLQIEIGTTATEYEPYVEPTTYTADANGIVKGVTSLYPTTTLLTDTEGVTIEAEYNKDANKVIANLMEKIAALENAAAEQI